MESAYSHLEEQISNLSLNSVIIASALLLCLTVLSIGLKKISEPLKKFIFISICAVVISTTLLLAGATIYLNSVSESGGPVHWHADIEIWDCGIQLNLKDPKGLSNKIGSATLHEHNDKRIHLEGVVVENKDASLGKFFYVIGGNIEQDHAVFPTNEDPQFRLGSPKESCNGQPAEFQVFAFKTVNKKIIQTKVADPKSYVIAPEGAVPPGDCIIFEFDAPKEKTEKMCTSYKVAKQLGKIEE